jgi:quercetin dioxygenase-like cupin family protein
MTDVAAVGPVGIRRFTLGAACQEHRGHTHNYDHVTVVERGSVRVFTREAEGGPEKEWPKVYRAGQWFVVKRDLYHRIKALEPGTAYSCMYWHRDHDGLVVETYEGNDAAYV